MRNGCSEYALKKLKRSKISVDHEPSIRVFSSRAEFRQNF